MSAPLPLCYGDLVQCGVACACWSRSVAATLHPCLQLCLCQRHGMLLWLHGSCTADCVAAVVCLPCLHVRITPLLLCCLFAGEDTASVPGTVYLIYRFCSLTALA